MPPGCDFAQSATLPRQDVHFTDARHVNGNSELARRSHETDPARHRIIDRGQSARHMRGGLIGLPRPPHAAFRRNEGLVDQGTVQPALCCAGAAIAEHPADQHELDQRCLEPFN
jgi:hypothetical protein